MTPNWLTDGLSHIWLPYAQMKTAPAPLPVIGAEGAKLTLADGKQLIDGIASWWTACHGYHNPHLRAGIEKQLATLPHVMFGGLVHEPALTLAKRLSDIVPGQLQRVFFSDSGSTAVEVALKMAMQYWRNQGKTQKNKIICFRHAYHGDTVGAMAVSDPESSFHKAFRGNIPMHYVLDIPSDEYSLAEFEQTVEGIGKMTAGLIIEPLVQAAGGMKFHGPDILAEIHRICKTHEILFIADEIATGFGRTGSLFACSEAGIAPDILCIGKALTGGMIGMGATLATETVFEGFLSDDPEAALMHGPTYMANPLACAAAHASLDLFAQEPRLRQVETIEAQLHDELKACEDLSAVVDVRVKGAIGVVQLKPGINCRALRPEFLKLDCFIRPFDDVVYLMPAFTIHPVELTQLTQAILRIVGNI